MDLPTCPACGQSVLDDDATDCPFCGAAMDGSAPAKPQKAKFVAGKAKRKTATPDKPAEDDDPFAIKQAPTAKKVVPCARKPMKGRLHRVVCPMCDAQGFIPKRAIGMQVKCANPECLVPVFTATADGEGGEPRVPTRVSDGEQDQAAQSSLAGKEKKNSLMIYGIVGGVLLAATLGLVYVLNQPGTTSLPPIERDPVVTTDPEPDPEPVEVTSTEPEDPEYMTKATGFADTITKLALDNVDNRDKSFCRRMAADAYLQLGMPEKAKAEFKQMGVVSAQAGRDTEYYRVGPLVSQYWRATAAGDTTVAAESLADAKKLMAAIPLKGDIAVESGVKLAAALIHEGGIAEAESLINRQKGRLDKASEQDSVRYTAWSTTADALREFDRPAFFPEQVFSWSDPLFTAVAVQLALHQQWQAVIDWTDRSTSPTVASDTLAAVSALTGDDSAVHDQLIAAAETRGAETSLRVYSVLSLRDPDTFQKAAAVVARLPLAEPRQLGKLAEMINVETPDLHDATLAGEALTDFVIAASATGSDAAFNDGIARLYRTMVAPVAPTAFVRLAAAEVDSNRRAVERTLAAEMGLRKDEVRGAFIKYRTGITKVADVAEERRRRLIYMLARAAQTGAASAIEAALAVPDSDLRREVMVDGLCGLISTAAAAGGHDLSGLQQPESDLAVPIARVKPVAEMTVVNGLVDAWQKYQADGIPAAAGSLESMVQMAGFRAATALTMANLTARTSAPIEDQMKAVRRIRNEQWQERALQAIATEAVRQDRFAEAETAAENGTATTTGRVMYLHALISAILRQVPE